MPESWAWDCFLDYRKQPFSSSSMLLNMFKCLFLWIKGNDSYGIIKDVWLLWGHCSLKRHISKQACFILWDSITDCVCVCALGWGTGCICAYVCMYLTWFYSWITLLSGEALRVGSCSWLCTAISIQTWEWHLRCWAWYVQFLVVYL